MTALLTTTLVLAVASALPAPVQGLQAAADSSTHEVRPATPPHDASDALVPDTILSPPGGPTLVLLGTPGSGVAALRLHVPLVEGPAEAGVGRLLRELNLKRMEDLARPVGARVSVTRTPRGLSYAVEGAVADFEYLAYLLREVAGRPVLGDVPFTRARQRLAAVLARTAETPSGRLAIDLRRAVGPGTPPPEGTPGTVAGLDPGRVLEVWHRSHQAPRMTLVVSAGLIPEVVLAATRGLGTHDTTDPRPLDAPAFPEGPEREPQALRSWYGRAWTGGRPESPLGPVTALLVSGTLEVHDGDFETTLQLRELPDRWALLAMGAAYQRHGSAMRAAVDGALESTEARLDSHAVRRAVARVRHDLLHRARTPLGLVSVVGRAMEHSGDATAAARYLAALDSVDLEQARAFLRELRAGPGATAEVRP